MRGCVAPLSSDPDVAGKKALANFRLQNNRLHSRFQEKSPVFLAKRQIACKS